MILPVYAFGSPVLKRKTKEVSQDYEGLEELIANMWETMYHAQGVGLAAPQVGKSLRIFLIDTTQLAKEGEEKGIKGVFINPEVIEEEGDLWSYEEGCLSIPDVRGDVERPPKVTLRYFDEHFQEHLQSFDEMDARVIQHEYDHLEGILFTELLKPVRKRRIKRKLDNIKKGKVEADYPMRFS